MIWLHMCVFLFVAFCCLGSWRGVIRDEANHISTNTHVRKSVYSSLYTLKSDMTYASIYPLLFSLFAAIMFFEQMTTEISENIRGLTDKTSGTVFTTWHDDVVWKWCMQCFITVIVLQNQISFSLILSIFRQQRIIYVILKW